MLRRYPDRTECVFHGAVIITIYPTQLVFDCNGIKDGRMKKAMNYFLSLLDIQAVAVFNDQSLVVRYKDLTFSEENGNGLLTFPA